MMHTHLPGNTGFNPFTNVKTTAANWGKGLGFLLLMMSSMMSWGQTTVTYTAMTTITCPATPTATISTPPSGLTFSQLSRGSGVTCGAAAGSISGSGYNSTLAANITANRWYTFSITSNSSVTFTLSALSIVARVSNAGGSPNYSIQYSIGGSTPTNVIGSFTPTTSATAYTVTPGSAISVGASQVLNIYIIPNNLTASGTTARVENNTSATVTTSPTSDPNLGITGTTSHGSICPTLSGSPITYTITNAGSIAASGVTVVSSDAQFVVSGLSSTTIAASGGTATYDVTFTPASAGAKTATITVASTTIGSNSPTSSLTGTGATAATQAVTSSAATAITGAGATLGGNVTTLGVCPASTQKGFVYSATATNSNPINGGTGVTTVVSGSISAGAFTQAITGLSSGTGYTFKAFVFNGTTYTYGTALSFTTIVPIANDDCAGAISITLAAAAITGDVTGATQSQAGCTGNANDDVWYSFTTANAGTYIIAVDGAASFDAVVQLFSGTCGTLSSISCTDVTGTNGIETVTATGLTASTTYYVRVYDFGSGTPATPTFTISVTPPPPAAPVANAATDTTNVSFSANWTAVTGASGGYLLDVSTSSTFGTLGTPTTLTENFTSYTSATSFNGWTLPSGTGNYTSTTSSGPSGPNSVQASVSAGQIISPALTGPATQLSFWTRNNGLNTATLLVEGFDGTTWSTIQSIAGASILSTAGPSGGSTFVYNSGSTPALPSNITQFRFTITKSSGNLAFDDVAIDYTPYTPSFVAGYNAKAIAGQSTITSSVTGLASNTTYYYRLRAVNGGGNSAYSNTIAVTTYTNSVTTGDFRTKSNGSLANGAIWEYNTGNAGYVAANQAPTASNSISVTAGDTLLIGINYNVGISKTFSIATGGAVIIAPTGNLGMGDATSTIALNGQSVTVRSTASGTGSLGKMLGTLTGATNVTVERYISTGNGTKAWRLLAANTTGQTIKNAWQEGQSAMATNATGFGTMITGRTNLFVNDAAAVTAGFDRRTNGSSILYYNATTDTLISLPATTVDIASYPGYFLYVRGDRSADFVGASTTATTTPTLRSTGSIFTGNTVATVAPTGTNTSGFTLVGNPFASAIDMKVVMATATGGISSSFQVWDPKISGTYGLGGYQTFTLTGGSFYRVTPGGGSYPNNNGSFADYDNVESGSAFYLQNAGTSGTVTIGESAKVTGSLLAQRPAGTLAAGGLIKTNLIAITSSGQQLADGNMVVFDDTYSNGIDREDVRKNVNFGENFGISRSGKTLVVEQRLLPVTADTIAFTMSKLKATTYTLEIFANDIPVSNMVAFLEDRYTNTFTNVDLMGTTNYNFTVTADAMSADAARFRIVFREQAPLPVTFTGLKAAQSGANIAVEWKVSNQINIGNYEVMKSSDGRNFTTAATIAATGATETVTYNWMDVNVVNGANYYRIKSVDRSGAIRYTEIVKVVIGKAGAAIAVSPNPVKGSMINLQFTSQPAGSYSIRLLNIAGQLLMNKKEQHSGGSASESFNLPSALVNGVYQLEVILPDNSRQIQKLIIDSAN